MGAPGETAGVPGQRSELAPQAKCSGPPARSDRAARQASQEENARLSVERQAVSEAYASTVVFGIWLTEAYRVYPNSEPLYKGIQNVDADGQVRHGSNVLFLKRKLITHAWSP